MANRASSSERPDWTQRTLSGQAGDLISSHHLTLLSPGSRSIGYFIDGQFQLLSASRNLLEAWSEVADHPSFQPTPGLYGSLPASPMIDLWSEWLMYHDRCENGDLQFGDRDHLWPSMEDSDFTEILRCLVFESSQYNSLLEQARILAIQSVEWELTWIIANARLPCLLPWINKDSPDRDISARFASSHDRLLHAKGGFDFGGMTTCGNVRDFTSLLDEFEKLIIYGMSHIELFAQRSVTTLTTEPQQLSRRLQFALLELYREGQNGIDRRELARRYATRPDIGSKSVNSADQDRIALLRHGYQIVGHPWKLDIAYLPTHYLEQIRDLPRLLNAPPLEDD